MCNFWRGDHWDFDELLPSIGTEMVQYTIERAPQLTSDKNVLFWKRTFVVRLAWEFVHRRGRMDQVACRVWAAPLPPQSKLLIWHLWKAILPMELLVKRHGYQLASRCVC